MKTSSSIENNSLITIIKCFIILLIVVFIFISSYLIKKDDKNTNKNNTKNKVTTIKISKSLYDKYKNVEFVKDTKIGEDDGFFISVYNNLVQSKIEIINGKINVSTYNDDNRLTSKYIISDIGSKIKYITAFDLDNYGPLSGPIAALTFDNEVYIGNYSEITSKVEFKKFQSDILDMLIVSDDDMSKNSLYLLTSDGNLKLVKYNDSRNAYELSNNLYEDRYVFIGNYHEGGISYVMVVHAKDDTIVFANYKDLSNISLEYEPVKFDKQEVFIKYVLIKEGEETSKLYIITKDKDILTTNKDRYYGADENTCKECYKLKKYNNLKVKNIELLNKSELYSDYKIKVTYENGNTEIIKSNYYYEASNY